MDSLNPVMRVRRNYNQWVANETLEDFALRFTAKRARRWSSWRVANTAIGSISFLALEAIGGAITLRYGFDNAVAAIMLGGVLLFLTGIPISYYASRFGVDIDLLTRGAGFGYIGSTLTSLIYASFTFIFFALEAAILSLALELCFGLPLGIGYLLNALVVIPLVTHGFTKISRFQGWTQPLWVLLHITPFAFLYFQGVDLEIWTGHTGVLGPLDGGLDIVLLGAGTGVVLSLSAQIGEQVDFLRFLPETNKRTTGLAWWSALISAGPGWAVLGMVKMLAGSFLAILAFSDGVPPEKSVEPTQMYLSAFQRVFDNPGAALFVTGLFVIISQLKINVTNAYAGSIAWSNFFSRLTHSHPGRVVWLVFNVLIALMLMEFGVFGALERTLGLYSHVAVAWVGAITADLVVNKPMGLSPAGIEFRRAHLYDINPVGVGAMAIATAASLVSYSGFLGETAQALSALVALGCAFLVAPLIAIATRGRYYLARPVPDLGHAGAGHICSICQYTFDREDMTHCPFYTGPICSLCCSLDVRCHDACKPQATLSSQVVRLIDATLPARAARIAKSKYGLYAALMLGLMSFIALSMLFIYYMVTLQDSAVGPALASALQLTFAILLFFAGVVVWLYVLAHESRRVAQEEMERQTGLLKREIDAHARTDAELHEAMMKAEAANEAKSRYVVGISHELRTPLNAILGYAQLLENDPELPERRRQGVGIMRRSGEHLAGLIESLLDISRIEAGRLEISKDAVHLPEFLDQLAAIFDLQAQEKGLDFLHRTETHLPGLVRTDEKRLRQILMNLLSNAVRYTAKGNVRFTVSYRNEVACFTIEDTGRGIAKENQQRIFEPFERLRETGASAVPGTGLGLTISKLLIELLGGDLQIDSTPGKGSVFTLLLMLPSVATHSSITPKTAPRITGYRNPRKTVMVVDDDADHRTLIEDMLRPLGFGLVFAEGGETALALAGAHSMDLFLVDVAMPGMDGWQLVRKLRANGHAETPIVMLSAHAEDTKDDDPVRDLADDFVAKPFNLNDLLSRIETMLRMDWILASDTPSADQGAPRPLIPDAADLDDLQNLARIGYVRGVDRKLDELAATRPDLGPFVSRMRGLVADFDFTRMDDMIEALKHDRTG